MALKGRTRIELTNVETSEVEIHEDNNMVTNALSKLLGDYGWFGLNNISETMNRNEDPSSVIKKLTGGIMLFDNNIEENPEIVNSPIGTSVVGCGSLNKNVIGSNTMVGNYNVLESGWTDEGGYKHVWDFSTSQSNGNISCISLTTNTGGKITEGTFPFSLDYIYGEGENIEDEILFNDYKSISFAEQEHFDYFVNWLMFADGINNRIIFPKTQEEVKEGLYDEGLVEEISENSIFRKFSIDLELYRFGFSNFSIFDSPRNNHTTMQLLDTVTIDMPEDIKNVVIEKYEVPTYSPPNHFYACSMYDENNIYILIKISENGAMLISEGETVYVWQIDAITFESSYFTFTNTTEEALITPDHTNFSICGDYILCIAEGSGRVYIINKNDNTAERVSTYQYDFSVDSQSNMIVYNDGKKFYMIYQKCIYVIDPITKIARRKNIYAEDLLKVFDFDTYDIRNQLRIIKVKGKHYSIFITSCNDEADENPIFSIYLYNDPTLLVTINNLETPVQKTSAQTMKVTYVLTQE